jgi:glycerol-3-phosphate dehydrogenase
LLESRLFDMVVVGGGVIGAEDLGVRRKALVLPETDDGRLLFVVPWRGLALLGTTDAPYHQDPDRVRPDEDDMEYLERHVVRYLDHSGSPRAAFAGLRTLAGERTPVSAASREHRIVERAPGVFAVVGGKLSSARLIGAEAVDLACARLRIDQPSRTDGEPLVGAGVDATLRDRLRPGLARIQLPEDYADDLIGRYGTEAGAVLRILERQPAWRDLMAPARVSVAEVAYTALHESVASVGDFALRWTSLAWGSPDHGRSHARRIASTLSSVLDWPSGRAAKEEAAYTDELSALGL